MATINEPELQQPNVPRDVSEGPVEVKKLSLWQRFKKKMFRMEMLLAWTILGVACGIIIGVGLYSLHLSSTAIGLIGYPGEMMLRAFQLLILPLMVFALMSGVFALRATKTGSGKVATWSLGYYLLTMVVAVIIGIGCVYAINPGKTRPFEHSGSGDSCSAKNSKAVEAVNQNTATKTALDSMLDLGRDLIPINIVKAAALPNYLGVMMFAITFAVFLVQMGERAEPVIQFVEILNIATIKVIHLIILTTPVGIASWIATAILKACDIVALLESLGLFIVSVLLGLALHTFIALPVTLMALCRANPIRAFRSWMPAFTLALGTSSSAAAMPVSMECGVRHGCDRGVVNFVIPLGTNVNRDGTALYEAMAVIFICQAHGRDLSVAQVIVVAIVATLAAIGTASIPQGGLITLITALQATGNEQFLGDLSVLYSIDWMLAMFRTVCNVWGDACATVVVDTWVKKYGKDIVMEEVPQDGRDLKLEEGGELNDPQGTRHAE